jgi:hypothetical protein
MRSVRVLLPAAVLALNAVCTPRAQPARRNCADESGGRKLVGEELVQTIRDVQAGDEGSIELALSSRHLLDGGDLEDLDQALGMLAEKTPRILLQKAVGHCLSENQVSGIVTALPLAATDDAQRQLAITRVRISRISAVSDPAVAHARDAALKGLKDLEKLLERVVVETGAPQKRR